MPSRHSVNGVRGSGDCRGDAHGAARGEGSVTLGRPLGEARSRACIGRELRCRDLARVWASGTRDSLPPGGRPKGELFPFAGARVLTGDPRGAGMEKLWGGRFREALDPEFARFNASFLFDRRLLRADIRANAAYCRALRRAGGALRR
jgi:hypothetical protein